MKNQWITESQNHWGGKRALRSSSPAVHLPPINQCWQNGYSALIWKREIKSGEKQPASDSLQYSEFPVWICLFTNKFPFDYNLIVTLVTCRFQDLGQLFDRTW